MNASVKNKNENQHTLNQALYDAFLGQGSHGRHYIENVLPVRVRKLIDQGADVNAKHEKENTILHYIAGEYYNSKKAKELLDAGADVEVRNQYGQTPLLSLLQWTAYGDGLDVLHMLVKAGGKVNTKDKDGVTPLHMAMTGDMILEIEALLKYGAEVNAKDNDEKTPLHYTISCSTKPSSCMKILLDAGADLEARDNEGMTPLLEAADNGCADSIKTLLDAGADINAQDVGGESVEGYAEENPHLNPRLADIGVGCAEHEREHILSRIRDPLRNLKIPEQEMG